MDLSVPLTPNLARSRGGGRWLTSLRDPVGRRARVESPDGLGKPAPSSDRVTGRTDTRSGSRGTIAWSRDVGEAALRGSSLKRFLEKVLADRPPSGMSHHWRTRMGYETWKSLERWDPPLRALQVRGRPEVT